MGNVCSSSCIRLVLQWSILLLGCYIFSHCALSPIPRDLAIYINRDIYGIAELEAIALARYGELTGKNYISDRALRVSLHNEIIPVYSRFSKLVRKIKPDTEAVRKVHAIYRRAVSLRLQGFRTIKLAIESGDPVLVDQANRMLDQGQQLVAQWQGQLASMSNKYGLIQQ